LELNDSAEVLGTENNKVIATSCIIEGENTKIVVLNHERQIRIYQKDKEVKEIFANIPFKSLNFGVPK